MDPNGCIGEQIMKEITFSLIEIFISLIVETIILGGLFTWVSNKSSVKMETKLNQEMKNIEEQNKLIYQELSKVVYQSRNDVISEIKEVNK
jgi:hypothetical protein